VSIGTASRILLGSATILALASLVGACSSDKLEPVPTAPETVAPVGATQTTRFVGETTTLPVGVGATTTTNAANASGAPTTAGARPTNPGAELPPLTGFGIGDVMFDTDAGAAIQSLTTTFGTPTTDSGWVVAGSSRFGACPGQQVRGVRWGQLQTLFSDEGGTQHFFTYTYGLGNREAGPELRTDVGVGLGSTVAQVQAAYPDAQVGSDPARGAFFTDEAAGLSGSFDQPGAAGKVTRIVGGTPCE
jgi:hypothetical protein